METKHLGSSVSITDDDTVILRAGKTSHRIALADITDIVYVPATRWRNGKIVLTLREAVSLGGQWKVSGNVVTFTTNTSGAQREAAGHVTAHIADALGKYKPGAMDGDARKAARETVRQAKADRREADRQAKADAAEALLAWRDAHPLEVELNNFGKGFPLGAWSSPKIERGRLDGHSLVDVQADADGSFQTHRKMLPQLVQNREVTTGTGHLVLIFADGYVKRVRLDGPGALNDAREWTSILTAYAKQLANES